MSRSREMSHVGGTVLCVIRHGDAGDALALPARDAARSLTPKGRKQSRRVGKALSRLALVPRDVWTSRLPRAVETADSAIAAARAEVEPSRIATAALAPDAPPDRLVRLLDDTPPRTAVEEGDAVPRRRRARGRGRDSETVVRWIVGHEPGLTRLLGYLVAGQPQGIEMKKGAVAVVHAESGRAEGGSCRLLALLPPAALRT